jgi:hypothetical protein
VTYWSKRDHLKDLGADEDNVKMAIRKVRFVLMWTGFW